MKTKDSATVPRFSPAIPIHSLRATVISGADVGAAVAPEGDVVSIGTADGNDLVLRDPSVSRFHLELRRHADRIVVTDHGSTNGTRVGTVTLRGTSVEIEPGTVLAIGDTEVRVEDGQWTVEEHGPEIIPGLLGDSAAMRRLVATVLQVAGSQVSVCVGGESGTGKELVARAIHDHSPRAEQPFVTLDCAAISPTLFASELFGHERGSFTGADRRHLGAFERAQGGTLFIDEVGELPPELQAPLLGVLERKRLRRVGGTQDVAIDVRVVCATHRDLRAEVNAGRFRLDLYYRLAVVRVAVPPLRERLDDIPLLIEHFLDEAGYERPLQALFSPVQIEELRRHAWPGNVRELRNVVLGALTLGHPPPLDDAARRDTLETSPMADPIERVLKSSYREARREVLDLFERRYLGALLERNRGNVRAAAREASMDRMYLTELLRRHGLS